MPLQPTAPTSPCPKCAAGISHSATTGGRAREADMHSCGPLPLQSLIWAAMLPLPSARVSPSPTTSLHPPTPFHRRSFPAWTCGHLTTTTWVPAHHRPLHSCPAWPALALAPSPPSLVIGSFLPPVSLDARNPPCHRPASSSLWLPTTSTSVSEHASPSFPNSKVLHSVTARGLPNRQFEPAPPPQNTDRFLPTSRSN